MSFNQGKNGPKCNSCKHMLDYITSIFWQRIETGLPLPEVDGETKSLSISTSGDKCTKCSKHIVLGSATARDFIRRECSTSPLQLFDIHENEVRGVIEFPAKIITVKL